MRLILQRIETYLIMWQIEELQMRHSTQRGRKHPTNPIKRRIQHLQIISFHTKITPNQPIQFIMTHIQESQIRMKPFKRTLKLIES